MVIRHLIALICLAGAAASASVYAQSPVGKTGLDATPAVPAAAPAEQNLWKKLTPSEQTALRPLAANWDSMSAAQKRKWLTVAKDFDKLPAPQQAKMHSRMTEWTQLSAQQRAAARINFAQNRDLTEGLTPEQRKVQWQAYQQLSVDEKRKLAESAPKAAIAGAAPAAKPQPLLRKEAPPQFGTAKVLDRSKNLPEAPAPGKKIAVAPHVAQQGVLLPGSAAAAAPAKQ
jgi:hypothetical protein